MDRIGCYNSYDEVVRFAVILFTTEGKVDFENRALQRYICNSSCNCNICYNQVTLRPHRARPATHPGEHSAWGLQVIAQPARRTGDQIAAMDAWGVRCGDLTRHQFTGGNRFARAIGGAKQDAGGRAEGWPCG